MRNLSEYEKTVIKKISEVNPVDMITISRFISETLFSIESGLALVFMPDRREALLYLKGKKEDEINRQRMAEFFELLSLIDYLRVERYIHSITFSTSGQLIVICKDFDHISQDKNNNIILDKKGHYIAPNNPSWILNADGAREFEGLLFTKEQSSIYEILDTIINSPLIPTQELKGFVANNFKTKEEIKHAQAMLYTKIALGIAILFGVISTTESCVQPAEQNHHSLS